MDPKTLYNTVNKESNKETIIYMNLENPNIVIPEDKLYKYLSKYKEVLSVPKTCISSALALLAFLLSLIAGWNQLGDIWRTIFIIGMLAATGFFIRELYLYKKYYKEKDVDFFIQSIRGERFIYNKQK